jgi:transposase-like protein
VYGQALVEEAPGGGDWNQRLPMAIGKSVPIMSNSNPTESKSKSVEEKRKRKFLSAEKKFQIFLEAQHGDKPMGEILRREGLYSTDLARIRQQVKEGALARLGAKPGRARNTVDSEAYEAIKAELAEKERAMADQAVELAILRKKTNGGSWVR